MLSQIIRTLERIEAKLDKTATPRKWPFTAKDILYMIYGAGVILTALLGKLTWTQVIPLLRGVMS